MRNGRARAEHGRQPRKTRPEPQRESSRESSLASPAPTHALRHSCAATLCRTLKRQDSQLCCRVSGTTVECRGFQPVEQRKHDEGLLAPAQQRDLLPRLSPGNRLHLPRVKLLYPDRKSTRLNSSHLGTS